MEQSVLPPFTHPAPACTAPPQCRDLDQLATYACVLLGCEIGVVSRITPDAHHILASHGLPDLEPYRKILPLSLSICAHTLAMRSPLVIENGYTHPLVNRHPAVLEYGIVSYLGYPVLDPDHGGAGVVCVANTRVHPWSDADVHRLSLIAQMARQRLTGLGRVF